MTKPARNIELKCRYPDLALARRRIEAFGAADTGMLHQTDTFFVAPHARLKLRDFGDGRGELISYRRPDSAEPRGSDYLLATVAAPAQVAATLAHALGTAGTVTKTRHLFLYRHTRIHLDDVEGLGKFVELETVISDQSEQDAHRELKEVAAALELSPDQAVPEPYVELLRRATR